MSDTPAKPPRNIPSELVNEYTLNGRVPTLDWYIDESAQNVTHNTQEIYEDTLSLLDQGRFAYYGVHVFQFMDAFARYDLSGRDVLIWGLAGCNCDAMAIWRKARKVYVVDYNRPRCDHEDVVVLTHEELENSGLKFDVAISFSSFEHDGLGRYGDPLSPSGDLQAMQKARKFMKTDGVMFFGVPMGRDALVWNAHRIYGPERLPLLLKGWLPLDVYSVYPGEDIFLETLGTFHFQPLLMLRSWPEGEVPKKELLARLAKLGREPLPEQGNTRSPKMLARLLEILLKAA